MKRLYGRTALVTGAARGMGRAFAQRLAARGASVVAVDLLDSVDTVGDIEAAGCRALALIGDISAPDEVATLAERVGTEMGVVHMLVNNAGIHPSLVAFEDITFEFWRRTMAINLDAMFLLAKTFLPGMKSAGWGRIINISSSSVNTAPAMGAPYVVSKSGVLGLTRALATEVGRFGVTVNAIAPNPVRTPGASMVLSEDVFQQVAAMQPIPRVMEPSDVVGLVDFLCSDEAAFITGQHLHVDGGMVLGS